MINIYERKKDSKGKRPRGKTEKDRVRQKKMAPRREGPVEIIYSVYEKTSGGAARVLCTAALQSDVNRAS